MPLRPAIVELDRAARRPAARAGSSSAGGPTLLVTGGSQGAQPINQRCSPCRRTLAAAGMQVLHIVGPKTCRAGPAPRTRPYVVLPYVEEMAALTRRPISCCAGPAR